MRPAEDATIIDTSDQGIDQVVLEILDLVDAVSE
jgi:cytidylate kinase